MPNELINEKSPYLQQHVNNPVNWRVWNLKVFEEAKNENKLVLLSIGYSTCHWCHVMEKETFEDTNVAKILNENFKAIKLDREERPDIDQIYMEALHILGIQGGWPLNIFLTPERLPITGGTYFPPKPMYGRPSFTQFLLALIEAWNKDEDKEKIINTANNIFNFLNRENEIKASEEVIINSNTLKPTIDFFISIFDKFKGGFKNNGPNKFPPSLNLLFLAGVYRQTQEKNILEIIEITLDNMKRGGIYDQLGGGLSRYSTDHDWMVPHFEKMLYDNSLFLWILCETFSLTKNEKYKEWIIDLINYLNKYLCDNKNKIFYSAEDADSEGVEGKFYVWELNEIKDTLLSKNFNSDDINIFLRFWGLTNRGNFESKNILHEPLERDAFIKTLNITKKEWDEKLIKAKEILLEKRNERPRPFRDEKTITAWNAYAISGYAHASIILENESVAGHAQTTANFIWEKMYIEGEGLKRRYKDGEVAIAACLKDYAALACAFLDLYRTNFEIKNFVRAKILAEEIIQKFSNKSYAFYESENSNIDLIKRSIDIHDGVEPASNALCIKLFSTLKGYGINILEYSKIISDIKNSIGSDLISQGYYFSYSNYILNYLNNQEREIVIIEANDDKISAQEFRNWIKLNLSNETVIVYCNESNLDTESKVIPLLLNKKIINNKSTFYICKNQSCLEPSNSKEEVIKNVKI